jgi:hypothetical protein
MKVAIKSLFCPKCQIASYNTQKAKSPAPFLPRKYWFSDEKNENFADFINIADFHVLGLFMSKKHDLSDKKMSVCHAPLPPMLDKFVSRLQPPPWKLES